MSRSRQLTLEQEPFLAVRSMAANLSHSYVIEKHSHPWHQLLCTGSGAMTLYGGRWSWIVPPGKAVLIPAGIVHSIRMWGDVAAQFLYFTPAITSPPLAGKDCRVLSLSPLLKALVAKVIGLGGLDERLPRHQVLLSILLDELDTVPDGLLGLPLPLDERAMEAARLILASPSSDTSLDCLAHQSGASRRTLERHFRLETGLSLGLWRQKARMLDSIRVLASGKAVTTVAMDAGYSSVSAFIAAFRKTFGYTPGRFAM